MRPTVAAVLALSTISTTVQAAILSPNNQVCSTGIYKDIVPCLKDFLLAQQFCAQQHPQPRPTTLTITTTLAPTVVPTTVASSITTTVTTTILAGSNVDSNFPQPGPDVERGQSGGGNKRTLPQGEDKVMKLSSLIKQGEKVVKQFCSCIRPALTIPCTQTIIVRPTSFRTIISATVVATTQATITAQTT